MRLIFDLQTGFSIKAFLKNSHTFLSKCENKCKLNVNFDPSIKEVNLFLLRVRYYQQRDNFLVYPELLSVLIAFGVTQLPQLH